MIDMPWFDSSSNDQYGLPVSASMPLIVMGSQTTSCRLPPASTIAGVPYPGSLFDNERHSSLPVSLSKATATLPSPPTRQMSFCPSTSGLQEKPQRGVSVLYSFFNSLDQTTVPFSASRQKRLPSAPSV